MSFPYFKQFDSMDCGPTCLRMIARHYGRSYSLQNLLERCHITREGVSLLGISDAAESIGLRATGVKITWEQLRDEMPLPCIVLWNQRHFVVVYEIRKRRGGYVVKVADPASGLLTYTEEAFCRVWLQAGKDNEGDDSVSANTHGIALMQEPTPSSTRRRETRRGSSDSDISSDIYVITSRSSYRYFWRCLSPASSA